MQILDKGGIYLVSYLCNTVRMHIYMYVSG